jgi:flagellar biosynthesis/type III secretory pathway protein FliH
MKKTAKQKQKERLNAEYMKGYRIGFDIGHRDGLKYGRAKLQEQLRELLNAASFV